MARIKQSKDIRALREQYPTRRYNGKLYKFYVSRAYKWDAERDKKALEDLGYRVRIMTLRNVHAPFGRYIVFKGSGS